MRNFLAMVNKLLEAKYGYRYHQIKNKQIILYRISHQYLATHKHTTGQYIPIITNNLYIKSNYTLWEKVLVAVNIPFESKYRYHQIKNKQIILYRISHQYLATHKHTTGRYIHIITNNYILKTTECNEKILAAAWKPFGAKF